MKNTFLSYVVVTVITTFSLTIPASAQDSTGVKDTSIVIPIAELPITNVKATGNKKTKTVTISMDFENRRAGKVDVSLSFGGSDQFSFASDKGRKYKVHTYYNKLTDDNPNLGYERISSIQFGTKKFDLATLLAQQLQANEKATLTIQAFQFDTTSKSIVGFHVNCSRYYQWGARGKNGSGMYKIHYLSIEWK